MISVVSALQLEISNARIVCMFMIIPVLFFIFTSNANAAEQICVSWFSKSKISATASDCRIECSTLIVDMGTFHCPDQCDDLCRPKRTTCEELKDFWKDRFGDERPALWPNKKEKTKKWTSAEKLRVLKAISHLPPILWRQPRLKIYRFDRSKDHPNEASHLGGGFIGIYDAAFLKGKNLSRLLAHEFAHELFYAFGLEKKMNYNTVANWFLRKSSSQTWIGRSKEYFVERDGVMGPDEDFANNIEYFLFERSRLKSVSPALEKWIVRAFGDTLTKGEPCVFAKN